MNGMWGLPSASCEGFTCSRPVGGGVVFTPDKTIYNAREIVNYSCVASNITGPISSTCDQQDTWNPPTVPVCDTFCNFPVIVNGNLSTTGPFDIGDDAEIECFHGYSINITQMSVIRCNGGIWGFIPQCYRVCNVSSISNSNWTEERMLPHGSFEKFACSDGFSFDQNTTFTIGCNDSVFVGTLPETCFADCEKIPERLHRSVIGSSLHGAEVTISCETGYGLNGMNNITCNDGTWSDNIPTCTAKECPAPSTDDKTVRIDPVRELYQNGSIVTFSCPDGFELDGNQEAFCIYGEWNPTVNQRCEAKECRTPSTNDTNVQIVPVNDLYQHESLVRFSCPGGYELQGNQEASCLYGEWKPTINQRCEPKGCSTPSTNDKNIQMEPVINLYPNGSSISFSCHDGFELEGNEAVSCIYGQWKPDINQKCEALFCEKPVTTPNLFVQPDHDMEFNHMALISYGCEDNFAVNGTYESKCFNGTWHPPEIPTCTALEDLAKLLNKTNDISNTSTPEMVETIAEGLKIATGAEAFVSDTETSALIVENLEAIADAGQSSVEVTDPIVGAINNLMGFEENVLGDISSNSGRIIAALEQQISNLQSSDGNYSLVLDNVGIKAVNINTTTIGESLNFGYIFPAGENPTIDEDLEDSNTQLYDDEDEFPLERTATSISVPSTILTGSESVRLSFFIYGNSNLFVPSRPLQLINSSNSSESSFEENISSQIISVRLEGSELTSENKLPNAKIVARFRTTSVNASVQEIVNTSCVFWSYNKQSKEGYWSDDGCERTEDGNNLTTCSCDRLASFAVLIRVRNKDPDIQRIYLYWITFIGSIISSVCLLLCIITLLSLKNMRFKQPTIIHINLCLSLLGFYISFVLSVRTSTKDIAHCVAYSAAIHYFCISSVAWMSIEAFNMYLMLVKMETPTMKKFVVASCLIGYGAPIVPVGIVSVFDKRILEGEAQYCFIQPGPWLYFGFFTVIGFLFLVNLTIFIRIVYKVICRPLMVSRTTEHAKRNEIVRRFRHAISFWFIMGLSWGFAFLTATINPSSNAFVYFEYLYCILIALQGIAIFLLLCAFNPEFLQAIKRCRSKSSQLSSGENRKTSPSGETESSKLTGEVIRNYLPRVTAK